MAIEALRQLRTARLHLHYADSGPADGPVAVLLHGWPDSILGWSDLVAALNAAGWRTLVPFLRGFGPNRFLAPDTPRSGQACAIAADVEALADGLDIERFALIGHDWGARASYALAALRSERIERLVALSVGHAPPAPLGLRQAQNYWYHWYFALPRGEAALREDPRALCRHLWQSWSPGWAFPDSLFEAAAQAFDNPDWIAVTLHSYRQRWGFAAGDPAHATWEGRLAQGLPIPVPTLVLHGADDRCNDPSTSADASLFVGRYRRLLLPGVGHFPQREAPETVSAAVLDWLGTPGQAGNRAL
ncbi:Alpha/beta hydrolase fold protein [Azotobacter vinelandii CA]|uniref:Alpha/beta hydrolase fold protein n=2 Tax=Azotobacter vinelandii TaxID=354 RepID=C1DG75_AZOVD|nr:alpha/beta hydrolase [Azotobacter vinelandii]ACO78386.1 Alpha/beta hydrolase fold protein [Azotobacter vinelandii DJ]AGK16753.1 Alpha/beta hydrolase fold protein [Azotobacter vinelandii CA]AGK20464.1 Alpha/beta hydrolase fold protein [Azotobacter vinelandii CA6]SFY20808.1 Pimeloyl-ACP methyl ester carboxylesterase [Azotobacter vinelandii]GLK60408.1 hydrolase [Azotobacter vinelandii]